MTDLGVSPGTAQPRTRNVLTIVSLVSSLLWVFGIGSLVGLVTGAIALRQIARGNQSGMVLAIAGITIGLIGLLSVLGFAWVAAIMGDDFSTP